MTIYQRFTIFSLFMIIFSFPFIIQADEEIPINQWTNEILIERGTIAFNTLETINTHLLDLEEALERLEEEIALKVIERKTLEIPEIPEIHEIWQKSTLAEQVLKILDARMLALEKHENLVAEEQALIKMHREVALNLASEEKLFAKTREKYNFVLLELENRLELNSLNAN